MNTPKGNRIATFKRSAAYSSGTTKKASGETISKWKKAHLKYLDAEDKELIIKKVNAAVDAKIKLGRDIVVGFNSTMRLIESGDAAVVCVAQDGHQALLKGLIESTQAKAVHTVTIPKLNQSMKSVLKLKSVSCFSLRKMEAEDDTEVRKTTEDNNNDDDNSVHSESESRDASAIIDDLREFLLSLQ